MNGYWEILRSIEPLTATHQGFIADVLGIRSLDWQVEEIFSGNIVGQLVIKSHAASRLRKLSENQPPVVAQVQIETFSPFLPELDRAFSYPLAFYLLHYTFSLLASPAAFSDFLKVTIKSDLLDFSRLGELFSIIEGVAQATEFLIVRLENHEGFLDLIVQTARKKYLNIGVISPASIPALRLQEMAPKTALSLKICGATVWYLPVIVDLTTEREPIADLERQLLECSSHLIKSHLFDDRAEP